jgi:hypothetical protein
VCFGIRQKPFLTFNLFQLSIYLAILKNRSKFIDNIRLSALGSGGVPYLT